MIGSDWAPSGGSDWVLPRGSNRALLDKHLFGRRTRDISVREDALEDRLMYYAAHGVKSNLVARPEDWPGVPFVRAVLEGTPLKGVWYNRTKLYRLRYNWQRRKPQNRGRKPNLMDVAEPREVHLAPIPGFDEGLAPEERRVKWKALVEAALLRHPATRPVLGADKVKRTNPKAAPKQPKRSPAPKIHTKDPAARAAWLERYRAAADGYGAYVLAVIEGRLLPRDFPKELVAPHWLRKARGSPPG